MQLETPEKQQSDLMYSFLFCDWQFYADSIPMCFCFISYAYYWNEYKCKIPWPSEMKGIVNNWVDCFKGFNNAGWQQTCRFPGLPTDIKINLIVLWLISRWGSWILMGVGIGDNPRQRHVWDLVYNEADDKYCKLLTTNHLPSTDL